MVTPSTVNINEATPTPSLTTNANDMPAATATSALTWNTNSASANPSSSAPNVTYPVSYGGVNGAVLLGMKFDVKDSVSKWEVATVKDIRMLVSIEKMKLMGGSLDNSHMNELTATTTTLAPSSQFTVPPNRTPNVDDEEMEQFDNTNGRVGLNDEPSVEVRFSDDPDECENGQVTQPRQIRFFVDDQAAAVGVNDVKVDVKTNDATRNTVPDHSSTHTSTHAPSVTAATSNVATTAPMTTTTTMSHLPPRHRFSPSATPGWVWHHLTEIPRKLPIEHPLVELYFSFDGFSPKWDEWVQLTSPRIAPYGSGLTRTHGRNSISANNNNAAAATHSTTNTHTQPANNSYPYYNYYGNNSNYAAPSYYPSVTSSLFSDLDVDPSWVRVHVLQRIVGVIAKGLNQVDDIHGAENGNSTNTSLASTATSNTSSSHPLPPPTNPSITPTPPHVSLAPSSVHFFNLPFFLWIDPRKTTHEQLYGEVWKRLKHFAKLPDSIADQEKEDEHDKSTGTQLSSSAVPIDSNPPIVTSSDKIPNQDVPQSMTSSANEIPATAASSVDEVVVSPLATIDTIASTKPLDASLRIRIDAPPEAVASSSSSNSTSASAPSTALPSCFESPSIAPFVLRTTNLSGTQCSKCTSWSEQCMGCAIDLNMSVTSSDDANAGNSGHANADPAGTSSSSSSSSGTLLRHLPLLDSSSGCSSRDWANDTTLVVDWNPDYFRAGLIDSAKMTAIELAPSVEYVRQRAAASSNEDNNEASSSSSSSSSSSDFTLQRCMALFTSTEALTGDGAVYCSRCKTHEDATKTLELYSTPPILVLHLKRLLPDAKLYTDIEFPLEGFDPRPFLSTQKRRDYRTTKAREKEMKRQQEQQIAVADNKTSSNDPNRDECDEKTTTMTLDTNKENTAQPTMTVTVTDPTHHLAHTSSSSASDESTSSPSSPIHDTSHIDMDPTVDGAASSHATDGLPSAQHDAALADDVAKKMAQLEAMVQTQPMKLQIEVTSYDRDDMMPPTTNVTGEDGAVANSKLDGSNNNADNTGPTSGDSQPFPKLAAPKPKHMSTLLAPPPSSSNATAPSNPTNFVSIPVSTPSPVPSPMAIFSPVPGGFDASAPPSNEPDLYDLYAVVNHFGAIGGGHYITYCLNRSTRQWYRFDDSKVTPIPSSSVVSNSAYMLFYERRGLSHMAGVDACPKEVRQKKLNSQAKRMIHQTDGSIQDCGVGNPCTIQ